MPDVESFLREQHKRAPGMTSRALGRGRDPRGESTYSILASAVKSDGAPRVLDLACGDGFLLTQVRRRNPAAELFGIDLSPDELSLARDAVPSARVVTGRVQQLPFEVDRFEVVLCHMALMLFEQLDEAVAEIERVLVPGGVFCAIVSSPRVCEGAEDAYRRTWKAVAQERGVSGFAIGDARTHEAESLGALFREAGFEAVRTDEHRMHLEGTPMEVWAAFKDMYNHAWLDEEGRHELERRFTSTAAELAGADGRVPCTQAYLRVTATTTRS